MSKSQYLIKENPNLAHHAYEVIQNNNLEGFIDLLEK